MQDQPSNFSQPPPPLPTSTALATASLVLGILALVSSLFVIGGFFGLIGLVLGTIYLAQKRSPRGMAWWGVILSIVAIIASIGFGSLYYISYKEVRKVMADVSSSESSPTTIAASDLAETETQLEPTELWNKSGVSGEGICAGDWDGDGVMDILVSTSDKKLRIFDLEGTEKSTINLPASFAFIEAGNSKGNFRLLGNSVWGKEVIAMDKDGKQLWKYDSAFGVNGAHWGDLDGDGDDEMIVGMNGFGGLHAVSPQGKKLWKTTIGNVWNQAVVPATEGSPALVFATEAGGTIKVFDAEGELLKTVRPQNEYFSKMTAARLGDGVVQGIASDEITAAFDPEGNILWTTPGQSNPGTWRNTTFAVGDADGDGSADWAFYDPSGDLILVSAEGEKFGSMTGKSNASFILVPDKSGKAILVLLISNTLEAYRFE